MHPHDNPTATDERMSSGQSASAPQLLPGPSTGALLWRALPWVGVAVLAAPAMAIQSAVPYQGLRVAAWLSVAIVALALFARGLVRARAREREEVGCGYTTVTEVARLRPELFLVDAPTRAVLSAPGQARPPDVRRRTVQA